jgi:hypothetical protein
MRMLLENKNAVVYGGEVRSAARSLVPALARGHTSSSRAAPLC